jgi:hypothetical protein
MATGARPAVTGCVTLQSATTGETLRTRPRGMTECRVQIHAAASTAQGRRAGHGPVLAALRATVYEGGARTRVA